MLRAGVRAPLALLLLLDAASLLLAVKLSDERVVFQTAYGDIEFGVYPDVRPTLLFETPAMVACTGTAALSSTLAFLASGRRGHVSMHIKSA